MLRRIVLGLVVAVCLAIVITYQATRPASSTANPVVFVPSPGIFEKLPASARVTVANAYWLYLIQYYGEHVKSDQRFDAVPALTDLITTLSPHWREPYIFGSFALLDYGNPGDAYQLLKKGYAANPREWRFPFYLGFLVYTFANNKDRDRLAAQYYEQAARLPGHLASIPAMAAALYAKGNDLEKAQAVWAQVYGQGDKYTRDLALRQIDILLPKDKAARSAAVAKLSQYMSADAFSQFEAALMGGVVR